jgi:hypothetical protein
MIWFAERGMPNSEKMKSNANQRSLRTARELAVGEPHRSQNKYNDYVEPG